MDSNYDPLTEIIEGSGGGGCFPAGTLVWTPSGVKNIQDISTDDKVIAFDSNRNLQISRVIKTHFHRNHPILRVGFWGGYIDTTPNHLIYLDDYNAFIYAERLRIDHNLCDRAGVIRPVEYLQALTPTDVYNLEVENHHTFLVGPHGIRVHNGGGGKSGGSPREEDSEAVSRATITILEAITEGPFEGFRDDGSGVTGPQKIFLEDTPIQNTDGTLNFSGFSWDWREGNNPQTHIPGFADEVGNENSVSQAITASFPVTRQIVNNQMDAIRIRLGFQLQEFQDDGDITGARIFFRILIREGNGAFVSRYEQTLNTRFEVLTEYDFYFPINNQGGAVDSFTVRVESTAPDDTGTRVQRIVRWQSYTEIIEQKLAYPFTGIVALRFSAEQFSSTPSRSYQVGGRLIPIPSNAVVTVDGGLNYSGTWDLTFYIPQQASSDPCWQLYDLLLNNRYGLGNRIRPSQIDVTSLYEISQYNNEFVNDGFGGVERRYLCNTLLQSTEDAHNYVEFFLKNCSAFYYWGGDKVRFWQDRPGNSIGQVTNANVVDGLFKYASTDIRSRNSVANVVWNDPDDKYQRTIEPTELEEAIEKYGVRQIDFTSPGCTSRGQAKRAGLRRLYTDLLETETVSFSMAVFGLFFRPGDIIEIFDWKKPNQRYSGLVLSATTTHVALDAPVFLPAASGYNLQITLPVGEELQLVNRAIANGSGSHQTIVLTSPLPVIPVPGATWSVDVIKPQLFRVRGMRAENENQSVVEIVCGQYNPNKEVLIEENTILEPEEPIITIPPVPSRPVNPKIIDIEINGQTVLVGSWGEPVDENGNPDLFVSSYQVQYKRDVNGVWSETRTTLAPEIRIENVVEGTYFIRVASNYLTGNSSAWVESPGLFVTEANLYLNFSRRKSAIAI